MAQNNLATQMDPQAYPEQPAAPLHKQAAQPITVPQHLNVSKFEKCLIAVGSLVVVVMALCLVNTKIGISAAQQRLQDVESKITQFDNKNTNNRQTINELMNRSRLEKIAKQNGMTLRNSKIRNVNK